MTDGTLDQDVFDDLQDTMGPEFVEDLINTFFEEAPQMLADLKTAASGNDADGFRRAAHSLKSNATTFGAIALANDARALELGGIGPNALDDIALLETAYAQARNALKDMLNE